MFPVRPPVLEHRAELLLASRILPRQPQRVPHHEAHLRLVAGVVPQHLAGVSQPVQERHLRRLHVAVEEEQRPPAEETDERGQLVRCQHVLLATLVAALQVEKQQCRALDCGVGCGRRTSADTVHVMKNGSEVDREHPHPRRAALARVRDREYRLQNLLRKIIRSRPIGGRCIFVPQCLVWKSCLLRQLWPSFRGYVRCGDLLRKPAHPETLPHSRGADGSDAVKRTGQIFDRIERRGVERELMLLR
mmetsp:Transcript_16953/g.41999  ORF Transcript_16953/g.41999 Transcript_16953/m.41999 type:complete len:247 (+) Transcript_16953:3205-3945(+)